MVKGLRPGSVVEIIDDSDLAHITGEGHLRLERKHGHV